MQAVVVGASGLEGRTVPIPVVRDGEALVRVSYAALNRADLGMAKGHRHGSAGGSGAVAGLEWAGHVVAVGAGTSGLREGDRVMCSGAGAYAEYALTTPATAMVVPGALSLAAAACLPVGLITMHDAIVTNGCLLAGESVLVQGASSGVGIIALQVAKMMGAGLVIGTSTNANRRARLADFGADAAVDSGAPEWPEVISELTGGAGVDLIIDQVAGPAINDTMKAAALRGRIVNVGRLGGLRGEFDFDLHALKRIRYLGVTFRTRSRAEVAAVWAAVRRDLSDRLGEFRIPVDRVFPLAEAADAQAYMAANRHFGKVLLDVAGEPARTANA